MIDILLSTYNGERFIKEQIDSILSQTFTDWRLIIRDDFSKDNTPLIIKEYSEKYPEKISILTSEKNLGCKSSFETLLRESKNDYVMFSDQDDIWLPDKVKEAYQMMIEAERDNKGKAIICCTDLIVVNEKLEVLKKSYWDYARIRPSLLKTYNMLSVNNYVTGCTMIINKKARDISLPFGKNALLHDSYIALKVKAEGGLILHSSKSNIYYRQHGYNEVGAIEVKYDYKYFIRKALSIKNIIHCQYLNYKQAKEVRNINIIIFILCRITYLLRR